MSRQIQFRRGTAKNHEKFIGANGEITVDTTNQTLRVHDGQTTGGTLLAKKNEIPNISDADYIIAWQAPTEQNKHTWYRKYKSGWVEQGGIELGADDKTITMPIKMINEYYSCTISSMFTSSSNGGACTFGIVGASKTKTSFTVVHNAYSDWRPYGFEWIVKGFMF